MLSYVIIPMEKLRILTYMLLLAVVGLVTACNDDDTFTTSKNNLLVFSTDTVKLDTTFSKVPTPTKTFWVYNRSGNGIVLQMFDWSKATKRVQSKCRWHLLGAVKWLSGEWLEVRNKDSIRVFVELTTPKNGKNDPQSGGRTTLCLHSKVRCNRR